MAESPEIAQGCSGLRMFLRPPSRRHGRTVPIKIWGWILSSLVLQLVLRAADPATAQLSVAAVAGSPLLTNVVQVRNMTLAEADARHRVRVTGVITYYDHADLLFIQDPTGGIYVWPWNITASTAGTGELRAGDSYEIEGFTGAGASFPIIVDPKYRLLGKGSLPPARPVSFDHLMTGVEDGQWIEVEGIVRSDIRVGDKRTLTLAEGEHRILALLDEGPGSPPSYVDTLVQIHGVCATTFNDRKQVTGVVVSIPGPDHVRVLDPAPKTRIQPLDSISGLMDRSMHLASGHRVQLHGVVILRRNGKTFFIQDATGGVRVQLPQDFPVQLGDRLEVVGYPRLGKYGAVLEDASATLLGHGPRPESIPFTEAQFQGDHLDTRLVRVQGRILDHERGDLDQGIFLQAGQVFLRATLTESSPQDLLVGFAKGSLVEVTGVFKPQINNSDNRAAQFLFSSPGDIRVLAEPSWWNVLRLGWSLGIISVASLIGLVWGLMLTQANAKLKAARAELNVAQDKLEARVQERTIELGNANDSLRKEITERRRMQAEMEQVQGRLVEASRAAGRAEIATNVLHNVGNVLNSVNVSATLVADAAKDSCVFGLGKVVELFHEHDRDLGTFVTEDPRGRQVPAYLAQLYQHWVADQEATVRELDSLRANIDHIKGIVAMQQRHARVSGVRETVDLAELVEYSLRLNADTIDPAWVTVVRDFNPVPPLSLDKHWVLQILVNLIRNSLQSCKESGRTDPRVTVRVGCSEDRVRVSVLDNGVGIPTEHLDRIFQHGFTTRSDGHGFGLHGGALAAQEMGGSLTVRSDGPGRGAAFTLELPLHTEGNPHG